MTLATLSDFDDLPCEANAQGSHHIHLPRKYNSKKLMEIVEREALEQLEVGQNIGAYPY